MDIDALATKLTYGLYVVSVTDAGHGGRPAGFVIDAVCQLATGDAPLLVCAAMNKNHSTGCIKRQGVFNLSILPDDADPFIIANFGFQSSADAAKWENIAFETRAGLPIIPDAVSWAQLRVKDSRDLGSHTAFFCVPTEAAYLNPDKEPLRYADYFTKLKTPAFEAFKEYKDRISGKETL
ncbi:MAG: flavin reductase family protein [Clostridiales Family XIII bacterium]|jgi:flavin reductase (DIM6/NTAB) family NADH-FMN oxidoreductase RutF|nr:flavin reductase family protein [Clostridiales Family XIII bacterium]